MTHTRMIQVRVIQPHFNLLFLNGSKALRGCKLEIHLGVPEQSLSPVQACSHGVGGAPFQGSTLPLPELPIPPSPQRMCFEGKPEGEVASSLPTLHLGLCIELNSIRGVL